MDKHLSYEAMCDLEWDTWLVFLLKLFAFTSCYAEPIADVLILLPCFTYAYSLIINTSINMIASLTKTRALSVWDWFNNGINIFYLAMTGVVYFILVFFYEGISVSSRFNVWHLIRKNKTKYIDH